MSGLRDPGADDIPGTLPKNFLRPCLLLLIREQSTHGYDLLVRLEELGLVRTDPGGLYRTLRAMEREGLVRSRWELSESGPSRRSYRLTDDGEDWLHAWAGGLRETEHLLRRFLHRYEAMYDRAVDEDPMTASVRFSFQPSLPDSPVG